MADWQMDLLYTDGADWNAANIVVGSLVRELGRATDGEYTRAIHEPAERQDSWLQSFGRGILDIGGIAPFVEAVILDIFGEGSLNEYRALTEANSEHYADSHRDAYDLGQLAGTGLVAAATAGLPGLFAATNLGRMGVAGTLNGLFTGLDWATDADDWQTALERFSMGAALGSTTGKYTGLPTSFGTSTLAGFGHGVGMDRLGDRFPIRVRMRSRLSSVTSRSQGACLL